jgi:hypothetical protein
MFSSFTDTIIYNFSQHKLENVEWWLNIKLPDEFHTLFYAN